MKKIKLDLDDLQVESFQTTPERDEEQKGTVEGYGTAPALCSPTVGCQTNADCTSTCFYTCDETCDCTCPGPCTLAVPCDNCDDL